MLPRDDPSYDPRMDKSPPWDPPTRHWYDRFPTEVLVAMVVFLAIQLVITVVMIFGAQPWMVFLNLANLAWYFVFLWRRSRR